MTALGTPSREWTSSSPDCAPFLRAALSEMFRVARIRLVAAAACSGTSLSWAVVVGLACSLLLSGGELHGYLLERRPVRLGKQPGGVFVVCLFVPGRPLCGSACYAPCRATDGPMTWRCDSHADYFGCG